ncbi:MAG: serine/threonine-protein kinase [Acetobacteraceae bacterium]|nr:serine/threonine-protein kinase [Acetobacteraceae bacterium]
MAASSPLPEQIGRYRIESVIGRGAMGVIYRAHDPAIDRPVAIKLVRADLLESGERADYVARFQREAQAAGRCAHPNIVAIYDFALFEGNPYLAMEFIAGVTLQQLQAQHASLAPAEIVSLGGQMLDGLAAAHALGVVHRDIKPANVMLTTRGRVKVTDFGISRLDTSGLTGTGAVIGTPSYMSPEQCRGDPTDARSDLFSTAVVLYELVTGTKPFAGKSQHEVWHKLLHESPVDSAQLRPDAPAALHAVIRRGLSKDPLARFQTADEMAAALRADASAKASPESDMTVVQRRADMGSADLGLSLGLDSTAMSTIERNLAQHVGPIARVLMRNAVAGADSVENLYEKLLSNVPDGAGREKLRENLNDQLTASLTRSGATSVRSSASSVAIAEADLARAERELARHVGPIARLLVKRAAAGCTGVPQLWQRLAEHVDASDRRTFLGKLTLKP